MIVYLNDKFEPLYPSDTILDVMERNGTYDRYPKKDILRLFREFKKNSNFSKKCYFFDFWDFLDVGRFGCKKAKKL